MVVIHVDGKEYKVNKSSNLLEACLSLGLDVPYFCWHPALGSIGACRQCAIKKYQDTEDTSGKLVMSCMTPVDNGIIVSIIDDEVRNFRRSVIECLMINHPHDCPVCEEGGNCHLQDMTVMTGHNKRRYRFTKRTHLNQYLGPFISHEMNRCITCYRCVRYYRDYADSDDFGVYGISSNMYFGRLKNGTLKSEFSGNLIEICPTGVFTDKIHSERYNRKWDMQFAPSICHQCSIGCNISPGERYGELRRIENRYNGSINHYFLCDLGRFGYGYVNLKNRPRQPLQRHGNNWITLNIDQAIQSVSDTLHHAHKVIGIGSQRASIESNFALRELVGADNFYTCLSSKEQDRLMLILNVLRNSGIHTPSLREIESYDAILVLGEDLTQTGARIALAVRQAVKGRMREIAAAQKLATWQISALMNINQCARYPLFITNVSSTRLDDIATWNYYAPVEDQARLGFAIANRLDEKAPAVYDIDETLTDRIDIAVKALAAARKPLIISGSNASSKEIISAAANIARALKIRGSEVGISFITSAANSMGLAMMNGGNLDDALLKLEQGIADSVIILESDLYRHATALRIDTVLAKVNNLIIIDHIHTPIQDKADFVLSATNFVESNGTLVNQEGRAQRFFQVYDPIYYDNQIAVLDSWRWLHSIHSMCLNCQISWTQLDHIIDAIVNTIPQLAGIKQAAPNANFRIHGQKLAREPHCYSGRTATYSNISVHELCTPKDFNTMFVFSMEGNNSPQALRQQIAFAWSPGWNSPQAWNKFQDKVGGHLRYGDPGVRLLEAGDDNLDYFDVIPSSFVPSQDGSWRVVPYWHLFGSEETSQYSEVIQKCMPDPYVVINLVDADILGVSDNSLLTMDYMGLKLCLPVQFSDTLSTGQVGLPLGFPGIPLVLAGLNVKNLSKVEI